jgi:dCTP deaminase
MRLCDTDILHELEHGDLQITPLPEDQARWLQPAGVDLRLACEFRRLSPYLACIRPHALTGEEFDEPCDLNADGEFRLAPGEFALARTMEYVKIPRDLSANLDERSTYARCGVLMHLVAGNIEPGFEGHITLELANLTPCPVFLKPGEPVVQMTLNALSDVPGRDYTTKGGRYQRSHGCIAPR